MKSGPAFAAATRSPRRRKWRAKPAVIKVLPLPEAAAARIKPRAVTTACFPRRSCYGSSLDAAVKMRFLVIYAHPVEGGFQSALHRCAVDTLIAAGHEVDDCDLYAENFQPLLTAGERRAYHSPTPDTAFVTREIERLRRAEGLVSCFPPGGSACRRSLRVTSIGSGCLASSSSSGTGGPCRCCDTSDASASLPLM